MDILPHAYEFFTSRNYVNSTLSPIDRLSSTWIGAWIIICLILSTAEPYVGRQIECFPHDESKSHDAYVIQYCYLSNTRRVGKDVASYDIANSKPITYYQWTNLILLALLAIYITPSLIYSAILRHIDISLNQLVEISLKFNISANDATRKQCVTDISNSINNYITLSKHHRFAYVYLFTKILNVIFNTLAIVFLCVVFGKGYLFFATTFIYKIFVQHTLENEIFPIQTYCDFKLIVNNANSDPNQYTVSCLLSTNLFLIFIFASMNVIQMLIIIATIVDLFLTLDRLSYGGRWKFVESYLRGSQHASNIEHVVKMLSVDGVLFLRLLSTNVNSMVVQSVISHISLVESRTRIRGEDVNVSETDAEDLLGAGNDLMKADAAPGSADIYA